MFSTMMFIRVFGSSYMINPTLIDAGRKTVVVDPKDFVPLIPGFVVGAPYAICPLPKILKKVGCDWRVKSFERLESGKWRYLFHYLNTEWTVEMIVGKDYGKVIKG
ncbi:hypothetical protein JA33_233 [Dickeya phage vB_DsoM_JA33]|uniref:Uncharacterized protein n=4 Tax=Salmondvirus TaxID=2733130 RepID=A0A384ZWM5_9CAUD|nr:hypothetical protein HOU08_gp234 [Dickeya phage vB_DsoM_JA29]YP_009813677.1 hypothetical protein HOU32_gp232 [Dickeya phage vB_DsoM_JA11]AXG66636.1 hypothetical protein JA13_233 [Dickeya phage vB_DsoM_JA13]AXG67607.1 hypothetical protein JA33_233 [Dickeya phage vB_DsoM_JA33]AXG66960.1 hypothetical protein JA29_234 [Dickeya phage vB_DsoM_JA29]AYD80037.1 hypothetical protein JA11_232 [Dickeya phage vB_DsoM_JA11]